MLISAFNSLQYVVLIEYMKKTIHYTESVVRKRSTFNCFHFIVVSFLWYYTILKWEFLKSCNVESETM